GETGLQMLLRHVAPQFYRPPTEEAALALGYTPSGPGPVQAGYNWLMNPAQPPQTAASPDAGNLFELAVPQTQGQARPAATAADSMQLFLSMIGGAQPPQAAPQGDPIDLIFDSLI